jgi:hypothetical protein
MHFKGVDAIVPCRCCSLPSTPRQNPKTRRTTYYSSIDRDREKPLRSYLNLPLRDHVTALNTMTRIRTIDDEALKVQTSINGEGHSGKTAAYMPSYHPFHFLSPSLL